MQPLQSIDLLRRKTGHSDLVATSILCSCVNFLAVIIVNVHQILERSLKLVVRSNQLIL